MYNQNIFMQKQLFDLFLKYSSFLTSPYLLSAIHNISLVVYVFLPLCQLPISFSLSLFFPHLPHWAFMSIHFHQSNYQPVSSPSLFFAPNLLHIIKCLLHSFSIFLFPIFFSKHPSFSLTFHWNSKNLSFYLIFQSLISFLKSLNKKINFFIH